MPYEDPDVISSQRKDAPSVEEDDLTRLRLAIQKELGKTVTAQKSFATNIRISLISSCIAVSTMNSLSKYLSDGDDRHRSYYIAYSMLTGMFQSAEDRPAEFPRYEVFAATVIVAALSDMSDTSMKKTMRLIKKQLRDMKKDRRQMDLQLTNVH